jgi:hypothetical protein
MATTKKQAAKGGNPAMDAVLARMLNTPPAPFTPPSQPKKPKAKKAR